ncbi:MAG: hypothetical protein DRI99_04315 [Candidatus Aminicenantes bacterium]|nr:MAG: hypothetical protein DRI99_04315 [Candidatus Aminicenantes bacterium]RLE04161.1 MAG: hypothetical protein DRJ11_01880 [Candidatus Aminicenantes bacterium]
MIPIYILNHNSQKFNQLDLLLLFQSLPSPIHFNIISTGLGELGIFWDWAFPFRSKWARSPSLSPLSQGKREDIMIGKNAGWSFYIDRCLSKIKNCPLSP